MRKLILHIIFLLVTVLNIYSQDKTVKEVLDKATDFYLSADQYEVDMNFTMYRGLTGNKVTESYKASLEKKGNTTKNTILGTKVYQYSKARVVIDDKQRKVTYSKDTYEDDKLPMKISSFLEYYDKSKLVDSGTEWVCEMVMTQKNFRQLPYGKVVFYINKNNYSISRQVLYFSSLIPFKSANGNDIEQDYGRLVIDLEHQLDKNIVIEQLEDFIVTSTNNKVQLTKEYIGYQLTDQTQYN